MFQTQRHFIRLYRSSKFLNSFNQTRLSSSKSRPKISKVPLSSRPSFQDFLASANLDSRPKIRRTSEESHPYVTEDMIRGDGLKVYLDVYGCQMNVNDTEVVWSILKSKGYEKTSNPKDADIWLLVTCSIREGAETKIWQKLNSIRDNRELFIKLWTSKSIRCNLLTEYS